MKSFKYTINGNVYKVHINSIVDDEADVEVNGKFLAKGKGKSKKEAQMRAAKLALENLN